MVPGSLNSKTPDMSSTREPHRAARLRVASRALPRSRDPGRSAASGIDRLAAMVIVSRTGTVNRILPAAENPAESGIAVKSRAPAQSIRLRRIHRDT
jgi:hypothetical protein